MESPEDKKRLDKVWQETNDMFRAVFDKAFKPQEEIAELYEVLDNIDK